MNVLVADDGKGICKMLTEWLSAVGHKVKCALTVEEVLQQIREEQFDVVFLKVIMPGIPSLIVLEKIKKISPKTKIVVMTGIFLDREFKKELKEKGALGFIQKPFNPEDIYEFLK